MARSSGSRDAEFSALYQKAKDAGLKAGCLVRPIPMVVGQPKALVGPGSDEIDYSKQCWLVDDGACGFAWVNVRPGNSPFAMWLKKQGLANPSYEGGVQIWISEFNQSVERKEACARAMAKVFQEAEIRAYAGSRLD